MSVSSAHADPSLCWNCRETVSDEDICPSCVKIQPVGRKADFYSILGLPMRLVIDSTQLTDQFHVKSRIFHPDFHQAEASGEQLISLENSAMVNQAFKTLKDPFERATYFLDLTGPHHSPQGQKTTLSPAHLMEVMEFKESLEEVAGKEGSEKALSRLSQRVSEEESRILERMKQIDALLEGGADASHLPEQDRSALWQALEYRKYLKSIERDLKARMGSTGSPKH